MDFPNQTQLVHRHPRQPLVLEVDMHDASQRDPIVRKAFHASVGQECLAGAAHALDDRRGPQFFGIFHISRHDPFWNPVVVELAHDGHQLFSHRSSSFSFVWRALYHTHLFLASVPCQYLNTLARSHSQISFQLHFPATAHASTITAAPIAANLTILNLLLFIIHPPLSLTVAELAPFCDNSCSHRWHLSLLTLATFFTPAHSASSGPGLPGGGYHLRQGR